MGGVWVVVLGKALGASWSAIMSWMLRGWLYCVGVVLATREGAGRVMEVVCGEVPLASSEGVEHDIEEQR